MFTSAYFLYFVLLNNHEMKDINLCLGKNSKNIVNVLMSMITNFLLGFNFFFGEEFGWIYFLHPRLQKLYGKRFCVILIYFFCCKNSLSNQHHIKT